MGASHCINNGINHLSTGAGFRNIHRDWGLGEGLLEDGWDREDRMTQPPDMCTVGVYKAHKTTTD
jgi:hypothetical protein